MLDLILPLTTEMGNASLNYSLSQTLTTTFIQHKNPVIT